MNFGKNRVQYNDFLWQYYRYDKFDAYFYEGGKDLALFASKIADEKIKEMSLTLNQPFDSRIIFVIYNKITDFRQSNIGLVLGDDSYNIGGVTQIVNNKVFIYFEGDYKKFEKQINAAIAEVMLKKILLGDDIKNKVTSSTLLTLPDWYIKGLISYLSEEWNGEMENSVKDGILSGKYQKFNSLNGEDSKNIGHAIWNFIVTKYGKNVIPNIIYITKITRNIENGFLYVIGSDLKNLTIEIKYFYEQKYEKISNESYNPEGNGILKKINERKVYNQVKLSPDGNKIAYVTNELGQCKIYLLDKATNKIQRIFKQNFKLDQITDYSIPLLAWHPRGEMLTIITEIKGELKIINYDIKTEEKTINLLPFFEKVNDFSYSSTGFKMAMSATRNGKTDIYVHSIVGNTNEQITNDFADDFFPRFIENSSKIIFSSNRKSDTLSTEKEFTEYNKNLDLFIYDYLNKSNKFLQLTNTPESNETEAFEKSENKFYSLSDKTGVINRFEITLDSTIDYIDTATHYKYFSVQNQLSNYSRNILQQDYNFANKTFTDAIFLNKKFRFFTHSINDTIINSGVHRTSDFKEKYNNELLSKLKTENIKNVDSIPRPKQRLYFTSFYINQLVSQIDFGFLNMSYQAFSPGGGGYYSPGMNGLFNIGSNDLFEDYKITGTFRIPLNLNSIEYLISIENLKQKLDKQLIFHKQTFNNEDLSSTIKTQTYELFYILKKPVNEVSAFKLTTNARYDQQDYLSTDVFNLNKEGNQNYWTGIKAEYIFDNSRNIALNIKEGTRLKIFSEYYKQIDKKKSELIVLGADIRNYQRIHKTFIWANRFATSTSFGSNRLIYYLGGVDNWIKQNKFDYSIPLDTKHNYAYQTIGTNMRGFSQNIRNGNSFFVFNSELRLPIIKYFSKSPINSDFLENFQIISFFDLGSAWSGLTPFEKNNNYNFQKFPSGTDQVPVTITIDMQRHALIYGYGFGIRSRLFGYFVRFDWAWGNERDIKSPRIFYLSLSLDF